MTHTAKVTARHGKKHSIVTMLPVIRSIQDSIIEGGSENFQPVVYATSTGSQFVSQLADVCFSNFKLLVMSGINTVNLAKDISAEFAWYCGRTTNRLENLYTHSGIPNIFAQQIKACVKMADLYFKEVDWVCARLTMNKDAVKIDAEPAENNNTKAKIVA